MQGLQGSSLPALLDGVARKLIERGVPLWRCYLALPTVNPLFRVVNCSWRPDTAAALETISHEQSPTAFGESPFGLMQKERQEKRRWRLEEPDGDGGFAILAGFKKAGATDEPRVPAIVDQRFRPFVKAVGRKASLKAAAVSTLCKRCSQATEWGCGH
jgi:hypothetical protein